MIIYKVTVNSIGDTPTTMISSNYRAERFAMKTEYYVSQEKAKKRANDIYEGMLKLAGFIPKVEAVVTDVEVIE